MNGNPLLIYNSFSPLFPEDLHFYYVEPTVLHVLSQPGEISQVLADNMVAGKLNNVVIKKLLKRMAVETFLIRISLSVAVRINAAV